MNLVGKIFTVVVFLMSVVFTTFALMVYAAHNDWRQTVIATGGLKDQLIDANKEKASLIEEQKALMARVSDEKERELKRFAALEQTRKDLLKERDANDTALAVKQKALTDMVDAIQA